MRVGIAGAGLGGLLAGLGLLRMGHEVEIFEKLSYPGGRFTNIERKGCHLSTGALHMIPHGRKGPLAELLRELGARVEIVSSEPMGLFRIEGRDYAFGELQELLPVSDKLRLATALAQMKMGWGDEASFKEWISARIDHPLVHRVADSFCGWSLSLRSDQVPSREIIAIAENIQRCGGPGIPRGGCKGVTDALVRSIEDSGGSIRCNARIKKIAIHEGKAVGITVRGEDLSFDMIISDIGPKATSKLLGINADPNPMKEAAGIKISILCDKPMLGHTGVLFTPQAERVNGVNEVTNADPSLAPKGQHLLMSHQALDTTKNVREEIRLGLADLRKTFPDFDKHCEVVMVQTYMGEWPVNRAPSGAHLDFKGPVEGLFYVGDAIKPEGWMETEGVAAGVKNVLRKIEEL